MASDTDRNETEILDSDNLLRRGFLNNPRGFTPDGKISSNVFEINRKKGYKGLSVDVERMTTLEKAVSDRQKFRLCRLSVAKVRQLGLEVIYDPLLDDPIHGTNSAHALIKGNSNEGLKMTGGMKKKLVAIAELI